MKEKQQIMELNQLRDSLYIKFYIRFSFFIIISILGSLLLDDEHRPLRTFFICVSSILLTIYLGITLYFFTYLPDVKTQRAKYKNLKGLRYDSNKKVIYYSYGMNYRYVNYLKNSKELNIDCLYNQIMTDTKSKKSNIIDLEKE